MKNYIHPIAKLKPQMRYSMDNWKNRKELARCTSCMYYVGKVNMEGQMLVGRCRKNAPTMTGFPVVFPTDFCGNHKLNENILTTKTTDEVIKDVRD